MQPAVNQKQPQREVFPICLFSLYVLFYSGQSIYNTYLNLYLSSEGLSDSQIGFIISVSTLFILLAQLFWGWVSDRVKSKKPHLGTALSGYRCYQPFVLRWKFFLVSVGSGDVLFYFL